MLPTIDTRSAVHDPLPLPEEPSIFESSSWQPSNSGELRVTDSIAGTLEQELNAHRAELHIDTPIKLYVVRINGTGLAVQAQYIADILTKRHIQIIWWYRR